MTSCALHLGDCLAPETGLASLGDKCVDHVICDPPYEAEAHTLQRREKRGRGGKTTTDDGRVAYVEPLSFETRSESAKQMARVARRWVVLFCQVEAAMLWRDALTSAGLTYRRTGIWVKPDGMPQFSGDRPGMGYESIVIAHAPGRSRWNGGGRCGVWTFNKIGPDDRVRTGHETQKPLALMEALVRDFTDPGETILDPFAGSGTTLVAAGRLGRSAIGWERNPKHHAAAEKRISEAREHMGLWIGGA
jgi:site-specific DNA-methyltransferase (adenine-specific)